MAEERKVVQILISRELKHQLEHWCVDHDKTIQEAIELFCREDIRSRQAAGGSGR